jgi:Antitoxin FitA-like, ribbon-helix-helix/Clp amino terminal domain, pathogenicity island component
MATLHVRNVPDELYELLRERAAANGRSIGAETCQLLHERLVAAAGRPRPFPIPGLRRRPVGSPGVFTRFTAEARQAVVAAQEEARALGHDHVGTDHLLLGVLARSHPARAEKIRTRMAPGDADVRGQIPFTPEAKRALELGLRAALAEGAPLIEPRHLLAGIEGREVHQQAPIATGPAFRVVLLEGDADTWEKQLNDAAGLGYDLVEIVDRRAILRR